MARGLVIFFTAAGTGLNNGVANKHVVVSDVGQTLLVENVSDSQDGQLIRQDV